MTTLTQQRQGLRVGAGPRKPDAVEVLEPGAFSDTWKDRPRVAVKVGIRVVSEFDLLQAKAEAVKSAWIFFPDESEANHSSARVEAYNDALIRWAVARGTCSVEDITRPFFELDEDSIGEALSPPTLLRLWDAVVRVSELGSPLARELVPAERAELSFRLASETKIDAQTSRMLLWCLRRLQEGG